MRRLADLYAGRRDQAWNLRRFREHVQDVHDPGELLALAEREIVAPLDAEAKRLVTRSAKRVATVTALSPMALIAVGYVLIENLRLLRALAALYGARPGVVGAMRLARMVFTHIVATGGLAMTDDLLGQFLGQDLLRRLSRRLGEGAFNGALTARIGVTALEVIRPMPFLAARPPRVRDVLAEALKPLLARKSRRASVTPPSCRVAGDRPGLALQSDLSLDAGSELRCSCRANSSRSAVSFRLPGGGTQAPGRPHWPCSPFLRSGRGILANALRFSRPVTETWGDWHCIRRSRRAFQMLHQLGCRRAYSPGNLCSSSSGRTLLPPSSCLPWLSRLCSPGVGTAARSSSQWTHARSLQIRPSGDRARPHLHRRPL